jgi:hypothetical protein
MSDSKKDDSGGAFWVVIGLILVCLLGIAIFLTPIGLILGFCLWILIYKVFNFYFEKTVLRWYTRFLGLLFLGCLFYYIAYYLSETTLNASFIDYAQSSLSAFYDTFQRYSLGQAFKAMWWELDQLPNSIIYPWIIGGTFISTLLFRFASFMVGNTKNKDIQKIKQGRREEKYTKKISDKHFKKLDITTNAIGVSYTTAKPIYLDDKMLNQMLVILGTTGSGKTETLKNLYARNILLGKATIVVDGKPDADNISFLKALADEQNIPFYGFNCENNLGYDFLNNGTPTEIKDKIIGLKNENDWDSDYYKTQAETYLQTAIEVLKKTKKKITLDDVIDSFDYQVLIDTLPSDLGERTKRKLDRIKDIELKDLKGLQNQLTLLSNSDLGDYLSSGDSQEFTLLEAINKGGFVYFALPSLKYPSFAKVMGKLVVNDIKTALYDKDKNIPVFSFFDEFSIFAGEQVLNLVNQGRGLGLHSAFGTQSLADLSKNAGNDFLESFMGNINTVILQRVNDNKSTSYLAEWVGTYEAQEYEATIKDNKYYHDSDSGKVSIVEKKFIDQREMQQLKTGEAFIVSKVYGFGVDKMKVNYLG